MQGGRSSMLRGSWLEGGGIDEVRGREEGEGRGRMRDAAA